MDEVDVTTEFNSIDFGATKAKEILQNVRMILATPEFSAPMNRGFAWNPLVDAPINIAQAKITARLVDAIRLYEPRAKVIKVSFQGDLNGLLKPIVRVRIDDSTL